MSDFAARWNIFFVLKPSFCELAQCGVSTVVSVAASWLRSRGFNPNRQVYCHLWSFKHSWIKSMMEKKGALPVQPGGKKAQTCVEWEHLCWLVRLKTDHNIFTKLLRIILCQVSNHRESSCTAIRVPNYPTGGCRIKWALFVLLFFSAILHLNARPSRRSVSTYDVKVKNELLAVLLGARTAQ